MIKTASKCRLCGNTDLKMILNLGEQPLSSVFPSAESEDPSISPLELVVCSDEHDADACGLVQLRHQADLTEMYGTTYGYFSSISPLMVAHLQQKVEDLVEYVHPKKGDIVLDIGCNDGTLLNYYDASLGVQRLGIDPSSEKFRSLFQSDIEVIYDFFSEEGVRSIIGDKQCRIITSIAMFYDIDNPLEFMRQIRSLLSQDGVWVLELSYLPLLCTQLTYDQICHEHVTYLSLTHMEWMMKRTGLKILDVSFNDLNGGSFSIYAGRDDSLSKPNTEKINKIIDMERPLSDISTYEKLHERVVSHREEVKNFFELIRASGKKLYGYGASTKGNIIMNYCGLTNDDIIGIGDRNPEKDGLVTPGTRIPIMAHDKLRQKNADYLFVFIWHLRKEVIQDESEYLMGGGKMVFVLPRLHVVDKNNYQRYLEKDFEDLAFSL